MLVGGAAGLLGWMLVEPTNPGLDQGNAAWGSFEIHMIMAWGALIGLAIATYNAYLQGGRWRLILAIVGGPILGIIGGEMGYSFGAKLQIAIFHEGIEQMALQGELIKLELSRLVALTPFGTFLGVAVAAPNLFIAGGAAGGFEFDWRKLVQGLIGGTIGGAIGALLFDPIGLVTGMASLAAQGVQSGETGQMSRAVYSVVLGASIALFIGIIEQMARQASLRLALGRNEGRDWPIYAPRTAIGRSELAQVPIFHDAAVAPVHAFIDRRGPVYWLVDAGSGAPTFLNGQPVSQAPLDHGANIQIGNSVFQFLLKGIPQNVVPQHAYAMAQVPQGYPAAPLIDARQGYPVAGQAYQPTMGAAAPGYAPIPTSQPTTVVQAQPAIPTLLATDGPLAGQRYPITGPFEIGREAAGLPLRFDSSASRRHASVSPMPGGLALQDLGSTNGTFLNGQRVTTATMKPGDLVKIGATTFRVE
jgi:pSer/pThr/pTyr-binding forkhead associated (FHA) protein